MSGAGCSGGRRWSSRSRAAAVDPGHVDSVNLHHPDRASIVPDPVQVPIRCLATTSRSASSITSKPCTTPAAAALIDPEGDHVERSWCYAFGWNSIAYLDEDRISAMIPAGLLVVPKDGTTPFALP